MVSDAQPVLSQPRLIGQRLIESIQAVQTSESCLRECTAQEPTGDTHSSRPITFNNLMVLHNGVQIRLVYHFQVYTELSTVDCFGWLAFLTPSLGSAAIIQGAAEWAFVCLCVVVCGLCCLPLISDFFVSALMYTLILLHVWSNFTLFSLKNFVHACFQMKLYNTICVINCISGKPRISLHTHVSASYMYTGTRARPAQICHCLDLHIFGTINFSVLIIFAS